MADFDATPLEEFNKKVKEQTKEVEKSTSSLRAPFRQLIGQIQETNSEFAKIAADSIGGTQDTMKGLITQRRKLKISDELETEAYKQASENVKESLKRQAQLEEDKYQQEKSFTNNKKELLEQDKKNIATINLNARKAHLDEEYLTAKKARRKVIDAELATIDTDISERQTFITKELSSQNEEFIKANEEKLKDEKEGRHAAAKLVDETNAELEERLEKAGKTENYDKFTKGIKTLSGGLVDINAVLDPIAETWGAFRDVSSVIVSPFKSMSSKIGDFFKDEKEENEDLREENEEKEQKDLKKKDKLNEKVSGGLFKFMKGLSPTTILLAALAAAAIWLLSKFTDLGDWVDLFTLDKNDDKAAEHKKITEKFLEDYAAAGTQEEKDKLHEEFKAKEDQLISEQTSRAKVNTMEDLAAGTNAAIIAQQSPRVGNTLTQRPSSALAGWRDAKGVNPNTGNLDGRVKVNKMDRLKGALKKGFSPKSMKGSSPYLMLLSAGLTKYEIEELESEATDARTKFGLLLKAGVIEQPEYDDMMIQVEEMEKEAFKKPVWSAVAAGAAGIITAGAVTFFTAGTATPLTIGLASASASLLAGGLSRAGIDYAYDGDDQVYAALEKHYGFSQDPDDSWENKGLMEERALDTADKIVQAQIDLAEEERQRETLQYQNNYGISNQNSVNNNDISINSPPQNQEQTNYNLQLGFTN